MSLAILKFGLLIIIGVFVPSYRVTFFNDLTKSVFAVNDYSLFSGFIAAGAENQVGEC